ncbi:MAG: DEAD/DEAH box helicase family protein [Candidatus Omnitrophica bacterium]|nr:DEAD/DEAH box helicase family protein [Candidatus Omnitrophota bacterium]
MSHLYQQLSTLVGNWRSGGYKSDFPAITEILDWAREPATDHLRYLRVAQFRALETYWYLRLVEKTPHILDLYKRLYPEENLPDRLQALGIPDEAFKRANYNFERLIKDICRDDNLVREFHLEALRETLTLEYPSYILALAMGAGKTVLIGAIIATEFAMGQEYPDGPFIQNALVFAPGKTIIESLRELAEVPYDKVLPPRLYRPFASTVKLTFTRDGEKDIPVIRGSSFNVVVTNTEKIRIQKETIRKSDIGSLFASMTKEEEARAEIANLRLQKIASLPHLGIFSDEAHHTYGQALGEELKKVRKTVDYLAKNTNVVCVVNTTGTPYFQRQPLRDVVIWYGLSEGIRDGILKEVSGNIHAFDFDEAQADQFVAHVVEDFFKDYGQVSLPNGAPAKLAIYFPQTDDLAELRPIIEAKLTGLGHSPALCLRNTNESTKDEEDAFNRLNDPNSPHRVILLVNKGTEGWNCPSLFACALARRLRSSNNFVLQAASRCLRQIPGNESKARIYLSQDNYNTLDRELQETYGETIAELQVAQSRSRRKVIRLRKINLPPLVVKQIKRTVVQKEGASAKWSLTKPMAQEVSAMKKITLEMTSPEARRRVLQQIGDTVEITAEPETADLYAAAQELAAVYRLDLWAVYDELRRIYGADPVIPTAHLPALAHQIEEQTRYYEIHEEVEEVALALVKLDGFEKAVESDGTEAYTAEISYPIDKEKLLVSWEQAKSRNGKGYGFHYSPYNFDSDPEHDFFEQLLRHMNLCPDKVEDIYFTGGLTDPDKTEFFVEYKGDDGKWHRYTPDFIIRRKDGRCLIVEIKDARWKSAVKEDEARAERGETVLHVEGRKAMALKQWQHLNPDKLKYELIFATGNSVARDRAKTAYQFVEE